MPNLWKRRPTPFECQHSSEYLWLCPIKLILSKFQMFYVENYLIILEHNKYILSHLTWMMSPVMNLISKIHYKRKEYTFVILWEYRSTKGNVYNYNMILLKLLTGKRSTDTIDFGDNTLVGWVKQHDKLKIGDNFIMSSLKRIPSLRLSSYKYT